MNKQELAQRLAKQSHRSRAEAADAVDTLVYQILKDLPRPSEETGNKRSTDIPTPPPIAPVRKK